MTFQDQLNELNRLYFFQEFAFARTRFTPAGGSQLELADSLILLGNDLIAFQAKARDADDPADPSLEVRWFDRKILGKATKQVRDTLRYLENHQPVPVFNHRGHRRELSLSDLGRVHKLVCYEAAPSLPEGQRNARYHLSSTAGLIHLIPAADYLGIVRTLLTPAELFDYLDFRAELISRWPEQVRGLPEPALIGQYLVGNAGARPGLEHVDALRRLRHDVERWDISGILHKFADRIVSPESGELYYPIVTELAKLKRNELAEFKTRYLLSREKARQEDIVQPYRFMCPRTQCGFVFIPIPAAMAEHRQRALQNFTLGAKYDFKTEKCIGMATSPDGNGWWSVDWCYVEHPWRHDPDIEQFFAKGSPFRELTETELRRYTFNDG